MDPHDKPPASSGADRRLEDRAAITLRVDYKRMNTFFADYAKNISKGGTFIRTSRPLDVGTEFLFVLSLPSQEQNLQLKGSVMWVVPEENATEGRPAGMGIKFKFETDSDRAAVDDVVERLMKDSLGEHLSSKLLPKRP